MPDSVASELIQQVGADVVVVPDAQNVVRHIRDYNVRADPGVGILALTFPRNTQEVSTILRYCNERRIPVQPQGGMTGLAGGGVPVGSCVVISMERMRAIRELDPASSTITVEAGVVMEAVQKAADAADLFFPLDLGGRGSCQIGGNVSTNAGGNRVLRFLGEHLTQPAFTCRLRWEPDMVALWDNRLCVHQAYNDYQGYRRELYRTTVVGEKPA